MSQRIRYQESPWSLLWWVPLLALLVSACASIKSVDQAAASAEGVMAATYKTIGDLTRQGAITVAQRDEYVAKVDAVKTTLRLAQDSYKPCKAEPCPAGVDAMAIAKGVLAALYAIQADLATKGAKHG